MYQAPQADNETEADFLARMKAIASASGGVSGQEPGSTSLAGAVIQLPLWQDDKRGAPAAVLRSALFGVVGRGRRKAVESELLASWAGVEIRYTGWLLDQADLDCWLQALHLARQFPLGRDVRFQARAFLRDIGRPGDGNSHRWLRRSLGRMQACGVNIRLKGKGEYQGALISEFFQDETSGRYVIRLNPLLAQLFDEAYVRLSMEQRGQLRTELARWLQGYVQSHRATRDRPHRIDVDRLRELCGATTHSRDFKLKLKAAMAELHTQKIVTKWTITEGNALEFVRPESQSESDETSA